MKLLVEKVPELLVLDFLVRVCDATISQTGKVLILNGYRGNPSYAVGHLRE